MSSGTIKAIPASRHAHQLAVPCRSRAQFGIHYLTNCVIQQRVGPEQFRTDLKKHLFQVVWSSRFEDSAVETFSMYLRYINCFTYLLTYLIATYSLSTHCYLVLSWHLRFYPRDAMLARVIEIATCLSVRLSVRPSVRHAPVLCQNE